MPTAVQQSVSHANESTCMWGMALTLRLRLVFMQTSLLWMCKNETYLYHRMLLSQFLLFSFFRPLDIVSVTGVHLTVNPAAEVKGFLLSRDPVFLILYPSLHQHLWWLTS